MTGPTMRSRNYEGLLAGLLSLVFALAVPAAAEQRPLDSQRSTITVRVLKAGLFRAFADNHVIKAPLAEGSVEESGTPHVELVVDASRMRVVDPNLASKDREAVQARMLGPEVLDTKRFAQIRFRSTDVQPLENDRWLIRGDLELHGQTRQLAVKVVLENGHYKGSTLLRQSEFGIAPISIAGGAVRVKDEVAIEFDIVTTNR